MLLRIVESLKVQKGLKKNQSHSSRLRMLLNMPHKKYKGEIYGTKTMSTELQNCSEKIKIITRLRSCGNTIIANLVQRDLSTKFMEM